MKYIVFDLEATCWDKNDPNRKVDEMEIIEIGAFCIDEKGNAISEFNEFIYPVRNPELSDYCKELTSITQDQVSEAYPFKVVIRQFAWWILRQLESMEDDAVLCSWGFYDRKQLRADLEYHKEDLMSLLDGHFSIKHQHGALVGKKPMGMKKALELEGIPLTGTHHRGIDDARNIAKIFVKYFGKWKIGDE